MNIYERYKKLINDKIAAGELTQEFIEQTTKRLQVYKKKGTITKEEYEELINLMNVNYSQE